MEELRFSIDEQKYDHRHGKRLTLVGWYVSPLDQKMEFRLLGDGDVLTLPDPQRYERPDVINALGREPGEFLPGFTLEITDADKLAEQYASVEVLLTDGKSSVVIWKKTKEELREFLRESLIEYHIDREEILYDTMLEIQGWVIDQIGEGSVLFLNEDKSPVPCRISHGRRPDVVERRSLDEEYKNQEIGFRISVSLKDISGKKALLCFQGSAGTKTYEIDLKKLRKEMNPGGFLGRFRKKSAQGRGDYESWLRKHSVSRREMLLQKHVKFPKKPLISIVIPLYCTPLPYLKELIDSIRKQTYKNWQLCLADGSPDDTVYDYLKKNYRHEVRISYKKLKKNGGISINTNKAIELARGEYLLLCDHDDTLEPDALYEIVKAINSHEHPDVIYTDEDKISMDGQHYFDPHFKSDFNLFRLRENNYICHIFAVRREIAEQTGYFRPEFDGAQDFDFIFRCCEKAEEIIHIPKVLYHWRCHMESTAADPESKAYAFEAGRKAVEEHYRRMGIGAEVEMTERPGWYRSRVAIEGNPLISVIIPNKDHIEDLELCVSSIEKRSSYKNYEILIVENNSEDAATFAFYEELQKRFPRVRVLTWTREFNYSAINNFAAEKANGEYLLFLNNDVEILSSRWMEEMLQICQQKEVSLVGAKLYYPDDTIQHAGVVLGLGGIAGHIMCRASREDAGYFGRMISVQEISAVTAACMMAKAEDFRAVGGFDEGFQVAFNDIDLCMKIRAAGKKVVFTPYAELYHYESKSRGLEDTPEKQFRFDKEVKRFEEKWGEQLKEGDPYYSPNLSKTEGDCSLKED